MMNSTATRMMITALALSLLAACGQDGFKAANPSSTSDGSSQNSGNNSSQGSDSTTTTPQAPSAFDKLDLNGVVGGTTYDNEKVLSIDKANNALLLYLPLPPGPFTQIYIDVPDVKGVKVTTVLDSQQKARVAVSIPLKLIVKDKVSLPSASGLPGGRPLPMMPSGEMPSLALGLNQQSENKLYLYFGVEAVGMFVESSYFPEYFGITAPIKNQAGTRTLGYFTIVPKAGVNNGGLFLSVRLPKDISKIIDDHLSGIIN